MHALTKVLQLEDGKVSDSSSTSDSSYSDSSSSTSSEEEAMPEYVPNPSLPPPPEYPSDDEYGMPNPSLGPQSEVLTDDEYLAPPAPAAPCEESHERPAKCQRCQEREEEFWSLAESHQLIARFCQIGPASVAPSATVALCLRCKPIATRPSRNTDVAAKLASKRIHPQYLHPLFHAGRGPEALSLQTQSALLLLVILRVPLASIHLILGVNHKVVEAMHKNLQLVRKKYVVQKEKGIKFGASGKWSDVEGDEATFDKRDVLSDAAWEHEVKADRSMLWEQWCGLVQRLMTEVCSPPKNCPICWVSHMFSIWEHYYSMLRSQLSFYGTDLNHRRLQQSMLLSKTWENLFSWIKMDSRKYATYSFFSILEDYVFLLCMFFFTDSGRCFLRPKLSILYSIYPAHVIYIYIDIYIYTLYTLEL